MQIDLLSVPVLYINLDEDAERASRLRSSLSSLGFRHIVRVPAKKDTIKKRGCAYSHAVALGQLAPPFIVLEDDCIPENFISTVTIPDNADALYLGVSCWGRMNAHSGPCVHWQPVPEFPNVVRIYNMLSAHAILYLSSDFTSLCKRIAMHGYQIADHHDIGFAEIQRYYSVYALDAPLFRQTSSVGTDQPLSTYPTTIIMNPTRKYWLPLNLA
jgi:hypothetical protein